jgi:hypothetical protein
MGLHSAPPTVVQMDGKKKLIAIFSEPFSYGFYHCSAATMAIAASKP